MTANEGGIRASTQLDHDGHLCLVHGRMCCTHRPAALCAVVILSAQSVIDALYTKVEAEEQKRAQEKQQKPAPAPAGVAAGAALATA